jgi:hypothetical protein
VADHVVKVKIDSGKSITLEPVQEAAYMLLPSGEPLEVDKPKIGPEEYSNYHMFIGESL